MFHVKQNLFGTQPDKDRLEASQRHTGIFLFPEAVISAQRSLTVDAPVDQCPSSPLSRVKHNEGVALCGPGTGVLQRTPP